MHRFANPCFARISSLTFAIAFAGGACAHSTDTAAPAAPTAAAPAGSTQAMASVAGLGASKVTGALTFTQLAEGGVRVEGVLSGLTPGGEHGFHVHQNGDCSDPEGKSAGPHFNPSEKEHGDIVGDSHVGDLGNISADDQGRATINVVKANATLGTDDHSYIGRAVVVHAKADDLQSQPAGDSGGRVACGVIQAK
jgi:Cu-Zn family superoxide dismutase